MAKQTESAVGSTTSAPAKGQVYDKASAIKANAHKVGDTVRVKVPSGEVKELTVVGLSKSGFPIFAGALFEIGSRWKRSAVIMSISAFMALKKAEKTIDPAKPVSASCQEIDSEFSAIFKPVWTYDTRESTIEKAKEDGKTITVHKAGDPLPAGRPKSFEFFNGLRTSKANKALAMRVLKASALGGRDSGKVDDLVDSSEL